MGQLRSRSWCWTAICCLLQAACTRAQSSYLDGAYQAPWAACSMMHQCFVMPHYLTSADVGEAGSISCLLSRSTHAPGRPYVAVNAPEPIMLTAVSDHPASAWLAPARPCLHEAHTWQGQVHRLRVLSPQLCWPAQMYMEGTHSPARHTSVMLKLLPDRACRQCPAWIQPGHVQLAVGGNGVQHQGVAPGPGSLPRVDGSDV